MFRMLSAAANAGGMGCTPVIIWTEGHGIFPLKPDGEQPAVADGENAAAETINARRNSKWTWEFAWVTQHPSHYLWRASHSFGSVRLWAVPVDGCSGGFEFDRRTRQPPRNQAGDVPPPQAHIYEVIYRATPTYNHIWKKRPNTLAPFQRHELILEIDHGGKDRSPK